MIFSQEPEWWCHASSPGWRTTTLCGSVVIRSIGEVAALLRGESPTCPTYDVAPVQAQNIKLMGFLPFPCQSKTGKFFCHSLSVTRRGSTASGSIGLRQEFVDKTTACRRCRRLRREIRAYFGNHIGVMTPKILYVSARLRLFLRCSLDIPSPGTVGPAPLLRLSGLSGLRRQNFILPG